MHRRKSLQSGRNNFPYHSGRQLSSARHWRLTSLATWNSWKWRQLELASDEQTPFPPSAPRLAGPNLLGIGRGNEPTLERAGAASAQEGPGGVPITNWRQLFTTRGRESGRGRLLPADQNKQRGPRAAGGRSLLDSADCRPHAAQTVHWPLHTVCY